MLAVEVQNLTHSINNKKILNNINFNLNKDSISCILGPSGSGKTTLLKLIAGLGKVQSGKILINGEEVSSACLLYTSPSPRDTVTSRMPSSA